MATSCPVTFQQISELQFHDLDYRVMSDVFACHNALGRLCDEKIYQSDPLLRLKSKDFGRISTEVPLTITWRDFNKTYYLDLVVDDAIIYELKAAEGLVGAHEAQLLNYLLLLGVHHGKLLNFRTASMQWRFVSTSLTLEARGGFQIDDSRWKDLTHSCTNLRLILLELLREWGAFLELDLYQEALVWFLGGESVVMKNAQLKREGCVLGNQRIRSHAPEIAFRLTAVTNGRAEAEAHLRRFLGLTSLRALQWINLNHGSIEFTTLLNN